MDIDGKHEKRTIPWWLILVQGIMAVILGALFLSYPRAISAILTQVLAIYWLISGIFAIASIFVDQSGWGWKLISGILGIITGFLIITNPLLGTVLVLSTVIILVGIQGIIVGIINLIQAFHGAGWGIGILGVLSLLFGLVLMFNVQIGAQALPWLLGILGVVGGIIAIIFAFRLRDQKANGA